MKFLTPAILAFALAACTGSEDKNETGTQTNDDGNVTDTEPDTTDTTGGSGPGGTGI